MTDEQLAEIRDVLEIIPILGGSCQECGMEHETLSALLDEVERLRIIEDQINEEKERNPFGLV